MRKELGSLARPVAVIFLLALILLAVWVLLIALHLLLVFPFWEAAAFIALLLWASRPWFRFQKRNLFKLVDLCQGERAATEKDGKHVD